MKVALLVGRKSTWHQFVKYGKRGPAVPVAVAVNIYTEKIYRVVAKVRAVVQSGQKEYGIWSAEECG